MNEREAVARELFISQVDEVARECSHELFEEILDGVALMVLNRCYSTPAGAAALVRSVLKELASALLLVAGDAGEG